MLFAVFVTFFFVFWGYACRVSEQEIIDGGDD